MSQVIYHVFNQNDSENKDQATEKAKASEIKIFNHIGKNGEKFLCMKFESIFENSNKKLFSFKKNNKKTGIELLQEIMEKLYEK